MLLWLVAILVAATWCSSSTMTSDYNLSRRTMSGGGTITNAADILTQMDDDNNRGSSLFSSHIDDSSSSLIVTQPLRRTYSRRGSSSKLSKSYGGVLSVGDKSKKQLVARPLSSVNNIYDDHNVDDEDDEDVAVKRKRQSLVNVVGGVVVLRDRVSLNEHLQRLLFLLTWSDRNNNGQWMGIRRFIDCYFSLLFQPYLGDAFKMNIIHVTNKRKICALFSLGTNGSYTILIMLNYQLWDRIFNVSTALPNRYFRRSVRSQVNDTRLASVGIVRDDDRSIVVTDGLTDRLTYNNSVVSNNSRTNKSMDNCSPTIVSCRADDSSSIMIDANASARISGDCSTWFPEKTSFKFANARRTHSFKLSLAALCLIDRLEYTMQIDRESATFSHVITLARFFSNSQAAKRLFRISSSFQ